MVLVTVDTQQGDTLAIVNADAITNAFKPPAHPGCSRTLACRMPPGCDAHALVRTVMADCGGLRYSGGIGKDGSRLAGTLRVKANGVHYRVRLLRTAQSS